MLFLNKLLPMFVLPLGLGLILLIVALVRRKWWPVVTAAVLLYVCSLRSVSDTLIGWLEAGYPPVPVAAVEKADAVVVLGGIFGAPTPPGYVPNVADPGERLEGGIILWQQHKADWLVFTGGWVAWKGRSEVEGEMSKRVAVARGVPASSVIVTREVGNTADESRAVADLMRARGWKRIILVSSAWHMPRVTRLFRRAGVDFIPFPVDYRGDTERRWTMLDFLPEARALADTELVMRECYGIAFYAVAGR